MADRHDDRRHAAAIVPDPEASLASQRRRGPPPPRVWPLWLLVLGLIAAGAGGGYLAWEERARLNADLARLSGELSNVHARFDTALGEGDALSDIEARLTAQARRNEAHDGLLAVLEEDLAAGLEAQEARLEALQQRLVRVAESAATREAMLAATQVSLDALERAGAEGRAALGDTLETHQGQLDDLLEILARESRRLEELDERLAAVATDSGQDDALERLASDQQVLADRLDESEAAAERERQTLEERLATLGAEVEALAEARDDERRSDDAMAARLAALEMEIGELRRTQLAFSARLEALRP
ncbi:MAG: hypothetical protein IBX53_08150 [Halomonas sp.]|uniref:hypothetical protein n=1 Tax=Halomonas sp. TaxID=1486246 RepID=UPI0019F48010|nr:hypothetical protein [Halomonas sp.]MBE0489040.1 hypothetical protein [Halomonas sp.]